MKTELSSYRFTSAAWDRSLSAGTDRDWSVPQDLNRPQNLTNLDSDCAFVKPTIDDTLIRMDASMAMFMGNYFEVKLTLPNNPRKMLKDNLRYTTSSGYRYNQVGENYMPTVISGDADLGPLAAIQNYNQYYELSDSYVPPPGHVVYTPPVYQDLMKAEGPKFTRDLSSALLDYAEYDEDGIPYLKTILSYQSPGLRMHSGKRPPGPNTHGPNQTSQDVSPNRLNYVFPFASTNQNNDVEFQRLRLKYDYEDPQITSFWSNVGYVDSGNDLFFWTGLEERNPELITTKAKGEVWIMNSSNTLGFNIACPAFDYYAVRTVDPARPTVERVFADVYILIRTQLGGNSSRVFGKKMELEFNPFTGVRWYGGQLSGNGNPPFRVWRAYVNDNFANILPSEMVTVISYSQNRSGLKARWNAGHSAGIGWDTQDARTSFGVRLEGIHFVFKWRHPLISQGESQSSRKSSSDDSDDVDRGQTTKSTAAVSKTFVSKSLVSDTTTTKLLSKTIKFIANSSNTIKRVVKRFLTIRRRQWLYKYKLMYRF